MERTARQPSRTTSGRADRAALAILALYLLLGVLYSVVVPLFESPDELTHYPYVQHLATGGGLPVQRPDALERWAQEGSQPPLYYALAAALTHWVDTSDLPQVWVENPHARIGLPGASDNRNAALHGAEERFPWRGTVLAVHLARLLSVLLGAGTVWCTWRLGRRLLPGRPAVALGAMAANAFLPQFLFISASVNNDNLVTLLASLAVLLMLRIVQDEAPRSAPLLLGLLIGLAALAKLSGLGLLALAAVALALREVSQLRTTNETATLARRGWQALGRAARDGALVLLVAALVAGWWYLRNWRLYGDALGTAPMAAIMGRRTVLPDWRAALGEFRGLRMSYWGLFGWFNVLMRPTWLYTLLDALTLVAWAGLGLGAVRALRTPARRPWAGVLLLAAWIVLIAAALLRWTLITMASQGRLLFPAIGALSLLLSLGIANLAPRRWHQAALAAVGGLLLSLALLAPWTSILPAYAAPVLASLDDLPAGAQRTSIAYGDTARLVGYQLEEASVRPGEDLTVRLYWQALAPSARDYTVYVHLLGLQGAVVGQRDSYPGGGLVRTSHWKLGQIVCDRLQVPVSARAEGPVALRVAVGLYERSTMEPLPASDASGAAVGLPVVGRVRLATSGRLHLPRRALDVNLGQRVRLIGCDLAAEPWAPGAVVPLTLYWQVLAPLGQDYTLFVHLVDDAGVIVSQGDGPPLGDAYPTSLWAVGETLADERALTLASDLADGVYHLQVGLYEPVSGQRLPIVDAAGGVLGDTVALADVRVASE